MDTELQKQLTTGARIETVENGFRLHIPPGGNKRYRLAQLDDYAQFKRKDYPNRPSLSLSLRARASADSIPGTWGFGLWNDPFMLSFGWGEKHFRLPALPNAIWFFHASPESYLSFSDRPGNGFLAQAFRSPALPLLKLMRVGATLPFSGTKARALMGEIIEEDGTRLKEDPTDWHAYRLEWSATRSAFWVDEALAFETPVSPRPPLGLVLWVDNMRAAWRPDGKIGLGVQEAAEPVWLEIRDLVLK